MTKEEAIKWIDDRMCFGRGTFTEHHPPNIDECWQAGMMAIKALRNQPAMEWIPINEKAPEGDKVVLVNVITKDSDYEVICMRAYETRSAYEVGWVNAWMPLPEPYKEENNNDNGHRV